MLKFLLTRRRPGPASILAILLCVLSHGLTDVVADADESKPAECTNPNDNDASCSSSHPDYLIIGAGGAGLQTALFLLRSPLTSSFAVLEKTNTVGSFWTKYPRFDELISINKSVRNETQRFRYDWHSFLECPELGMMDVTKDYFPTGKSWHRYMMRVRDATPGLKERIEFGVEVERFGKGEGGIPCAYIKGGEMRCARKRIFVGTGLKHKDEPILRALGGIPYSEATKERAVNKRVCILGNGNSGFELAQNLYGVADRVTLYGRSPHRLSAVTRYTGDVRVKYLQALENLNGKLLDTVDNFAFTPRIHGEEKLPLKEPKLKILREMVRTAAWLDQFECDAFFYATGVESVVPGMNLGQGGEGGGLFPPTNDWYAVEDNDNIHYVGWLMHGEDFRQGSGGFFSGFRYLIRNLIQHVLEEDHGVKYPYRAFQTKEEVMRHSVARIQVADDLIILQDGRVLRDAIVPMKEDGVEIYHYYEGVTYEYHDEFKNREDILYLYLSWGNGKTASHVFDAVWRYSDSGTLINVFLHPVVQVGQNLTQHMHEDLDMSWKDRAYVGSIEYVMMQALNGKVDKFMPVRHFPWERSVINQTGDAGYVAAPLKTALDPRVFQDLWKAVYTGARQELMTLMGSMQKWQPALFDVELFST